MGVAEHTGPQTRLRGGAGVRLEEREQMAWLWPMQVWLGPHCMSLVAPGFPLVSTMEPLALTEVTVLRERRECGAGKASGHTPSPDPSAVPAGFRAEEATKVWLGNLTAAAARELGGSAEVPAQSPGTGQRDVRDTCSWEEARFDDRRGGDVNNGGGFPLCD